jgi:Flp pilus assembly protein TadB
VSLERTVVGNGQRRALRDTSTRSLVAGIAQDARALIELEVEAAKLDLRDELRRAGTTAGTIATGASLGAVGAAFLLLMIALVLAAYTALPLWGAIGIVGGVLVIAGAGLVGWSVTRARRLGVPGKRAALEAKKDVQWIQESVSEAR